MTGRYRKPSGRVLRSRVLAGAVVVLGLTACGPSDHATDEPIVATVGSTAISRESYDLLLSLSRQPRPFGDTDAEPILPTPKDILAELVKEKLLEQETARRGLETGRGVSARDSLAADIAGQFRSTTEEQRLFFDEHRHLFTRKTQMRFLHFRAPQAEMELSTKMSVAEFSTICEEATAMENGRRQWGDIGWIQAGHAHWQGKPEWKHQSTRSTTKRVDSQGRQHLYRAMHFRPSARYRFHQVDDQCRHLITAGDIQAEIRRVLLRAARSTPITIVDETLDFDLDPFSIARTEPGPALDRNTESMVWIAGGTFTTGSTDAEIDERVRICKQYVEPALGEGSCARWKYEDEIQRQVTVNSFFMDRTEVRWEDYLLFVETTRYRPLPESWSGEPGFPVANVNRQDADAYCRWQGKRLPTADEWEFAARGVDGRRYPWGNESPDGTRANFCDANCPKAWHNYDHDDGFAGPAPVGSFPAGATPEGLLDMGGNIREWTATTDDDRSDVKGGGFYNAIDDLIAADVRRNLIETRNPTIGFRCVQDPQTHEPSGGE
ncbi:MAG: SUMF1/EgtB/PvdO family nonheme iron enzyme [Thermoanaerobaculales bacterium]|nr:SUMF1/EgtB/PvdO family nonheme iron enzyme [Thermoanaerobaculales bacterium]